jgi:hypothetical protein
VAAQPWIRHVNARQRGYSVVTLTPTGGTADYRVMATTLEPTSTVSTDFTDVLAIREPIEPTDPPGTPTPPTDPAPPPAAVPVSGSASYTG